MSEPTITTNPLFICAKCGKSYDNPSELFTHIALCKTIVTVFYPNAEVNITRDEQGRLACFCNYSSCKRYYLSEKDLLAHIDNDQCHFIGPQDDEDNPFVATSNPTLPLMSTNGEVDSVALHPLTETDPKDTNVAIHIGEALETHDYLTSIGLYYHDETSMLICPTCGIALTRVHGFSHVKSHHPVFRSVLNKEAYQVACQQAGIEAQFPEFIPLMAPITGLPLYTDALLCPIPTCGKVYGKQGSMDYHHRHEHSTDAKPAGYVTVHAQRFDNQKSRSYFQVRSPRATSPTLGHSLDWLSSRESFIEEAIKEDPGDFNDVRELNDFLRLTKWPQHTKPYKLVELRPLVKDIDHKNLELPWLKKALLHKFRADMALIELTPLLVLQRLNTPDPVKGGIVNDPFHAHQQAKTLDKYVHEVSRLVAFMLRDRGSYQLPLPIHVTQAIQDLTLAAPPNTTNPTQQSLSFYLQRLFMCLWGTRWSPHKDNAVADPTMCYIILSSIRQDISWAQPKDITGMLARLTYCIRLVVLRGIHSPEHSTLVKGLDSLQTMFTEKVESTFNSIRSLQHLATSFAMSTVSLPSAFWANAEYTEIVFRGTRIQINDVRAMGRNMILSTFHFMYNNIFFGKDVFIQYDHVADDLTEHTPGYNIFHDRRNAFLEKRKNVLLEALLDDPAVRSRYIYGFRPEGGEPMWNIGRVRLWFRHYCELQLQFTTLIQMLGGAPARGTELSCVQYTNTPHQARGFYKMNTHWVILCRYTKTSALTGHDKFIPHGIDAFTGDMIFQSLVHALPLAKVFASILYPNNTQVQKLLNTFLFPDDQKILDSETLSRSMRDASIQTLGVALGLSDWRQLFVAVKHKHCPDLEQIASLDTTDTVSALQAGHSRQTEDRIYGLTQESYAHHSEDLLQAFLSFSDKWDKFMNVPSGALELCSRLLLSPSAYLPYLPKYPPIDNLAEGEPEFVRSLIPPARKTVTSRSLFSQWPPADSEQEALSQLEAQCLAILRQLLGKSEATWTSPEQKDAVLAAASRCNDVAAILPTGGGKTMVALIPAMLNPTSVTLIVVPFVSLLHDYQLRLQHMNIPYSIFTMNNRRISGIEPILLVTAEISRTAHFTQCLIEAHHRGILIQAFVFDEFHTVHTAQHYRESLQHIYSLRSIPAQWILLSGTIPTRSVDVILHNFNLHPKAIVIRAKTNRPELKYAIHPPVHSDDQLLKNIYNLYSIARMSWKPQDRGLVYVPYMEFGWEVASRLKCDFYAGSQSMSDEERHQKHRDWIEGKHDIMVCTQAFGCGNDYSHVKWVCHAGTPYEMIHYIQEIGRAGRNKEPSLCELVPKSKVLQPLPQGVIDHGGSQVMHELIFKSKLCIRFTLTEFTDGEGVFCKDDNNNQTCSRCSEALALASPSLSQAPKRDASDSEDTPTPGSSSQSTAYSQNASPPYPSSGSSSQSNIYQRQVDSSKKRKVESTLQVINYNKRLRDVLTAIQGQCTYCLVNKQELNPEGHLANQCAHFNFSGMRSWRSQNPVRFKAPLHKPTCFRCHVPQAPYGDSAVHPKVTTLDECPYPDLILPLLFTLYHDSKQHEALEKAFDITLSTEKEFTQWLSGKPVEGHLNNSMAVLLWFAEKGL